VGKQAQRCKARRQQTHGGRCGSDGTKDMALTWGDLHGPPYGGCSGEVSRGRSSGWIRAVTVRVKAEDLQAHEGPNIEVFQMPLGSPAVRRGSPAISGTEYE